MDSNTFNATPVILEKINRLRGLLWQGKKEYEQLAANVPDKELRQTILTLAQENNQYACELSSQMQTLGGVLSKDQLDESPTQIETKIFKDEGEVLTICKLIEKKMVSAYQEILNESFLYEGLRKLIRYQLNGILHAFMQIKLLNSLKVHLQPSPITI